MKKKILVPVVATLMMVSGLVGGTLAYLTDTTEEVKNTFTVGNVNIDLTESEDLNLKMVPGNTITKDPKVTVSAGSETCYLFVDIDESTNLTDFINYTVAEDWTLFNETEKIYVYKDVVDATTAEKVFSVLKDDTVTTKPGVTKEMMDALTDTTMPELTFTAYAVQSAGSKDANEAWAKITAPVEP